MDKTKSATIATQLEQMILSGEFETGEYLPSQQDLAKRFDASPRSIREALNNLEVKGLVTIVQGKRTMVNETSLDKFIESLSSSLLTKMELDKKLLIDLIQVRITIEVSAARELSRSPQRKRIVQKLETILREMKQIFQDNPNTSYISHFQDLDNEFHTTIVNANDNQILSSIHDSLSPLIQKFLRLVSYTKEERAKKLDHYEYLVEGFVDGRTDLVVALMLVILNDTKSKCEMLNL